MEEIIIDGINVAGCVLYNNGKCRDLGHLVQGEYMECNSMCDYGAYARKEQLKRLEQENAELKERISKNKAEEIGRETYLELKIKNYKQALEEISRRVQLENADDCLLDIMDIINEVLND